jgi:LysW-gamma-L-lysine carboxypeptidase
MQLNLKISVPDSSHASAPWLSKNAILESMIFARELKEKLEANQEGKTKGMLLTATMTEVKGGTSHNVTPKRLRDNI